MKFTQYGLDEELEEEHFAKIKSKKQILKDRQAVSQLISRAENPADPDAKFEQADLNEISREGFLDELISGIETGQGGLGLPRQELGGPGCREDLYRPAHALLQARPVLQAGQVHR